MKIRKSFKRLFPDTGFTPAFFLFVSFAGGFMQCRAQTLTNSPYSRYGLGELQHTNFAHLVAFGGMYNALQNDTLAPFMLNPSNPASHAALRLTVFDFGISGSVHQLETSGKEFTETTTALSYFALGFPVGNLKWWGGSIGLLPYSHVGYKIHDQQEADSIGTVNYSYTGEGGINQLYWGNGFRIKNLSVGINAAYLFGDLFYNSRDSFPKGNNFFNTKVVQTTGIRDWHLTFGAQYVQRFKKEWSLALGATGSLQNSLSASQTTFAATYQNVFGVEIVKDTILYEDDKKEKVTIPLMLGTGWVLKKGEKFLLGADYSMQDWSSFSSFGQGGALKNSQRIIFGMQYIPDKSAGTKEPYYKKMYYRAGFRYTDTFLELNNTKVEEFAVTLGAGFPLRKIKIGEMHSQSIVNIALEFGQRGTLENNLVREKYVKAVFSFTLNDRWFIKRKYD